MVSTIFGLSSSTSILLEHGTGCRSRIRLGKIAFLWEFQDISFSELPYRASHFGRSILGSVVVDENTGDIMVFASSMKPAQILYRSEDHGRTWKKEDVVLKPDENGWLPCLMCSSEPGITLRKHRRMRRGRTAYFPRSGSP